jgi:hypothetical protein
MRANELHFVVTGRGGRPILRDQSHLIRRFIGLCATRQLFICAGLTCDNARPWNHAHDRLMPELIAKANQAILEAQSLRRERRSLRLQASVLARQLGQTIVQSQRTERESVRLKISLDQALSDPVGSIELSCP